MDVRLLILAFGTFAIGTDNYVVAGILPQVAQSLDTSIAAAGQFVTVYSLVYAVSAPIMATLTANWPRRSALLLGLVIFVAGNILTATQQTFELALLGRAVAGIGGGIVSPLSGAIAAALVPPERRGRAFAVVIAGLSGATALGAPIGTLVGSFGDWRLTMWFVAGLGILAGLGVLAAVPAVAAAAPLKLRDRLAPLGDARVAMTLVTSLIVFSGIFLIYTYISVVFDRATAGDGSRVAALMSIWGVGATVGILGAGSLVDRFGGRRIINLAIIFTALDFALIHWSSADFASALVAVGIWGMCGWGLFISQQHRVVGITPTLAPILIALNGSAVYLAVSASGAGGALAIRLVDPHDLPFYSAATIFSGIVTAELAHRLIRRRNKATVAAQPIAPETGKTAPAE